MTKAKQHNTLKSDNKKNQQTYLHFKSNSNKRQNSFDVTDRDKIV